MYAQATSSVVRLHVRLFFLSLTLVALLVSVGCSAVQNGFLSRRLRDANSLSDPAREARAANDGPQPLPRELAKGVASLYTVEPGDVLLVQPSDLDASTRFPGDQPVFPDGTINLGQYGLLVVAGLTVPEVETHVRARIEAAIKDQAASKEPQTPAERREVGPITVRVVTRQSKVYYVLGEVNAPGAFPLKGNETVLDGILSAGGITERGSQRDIILSRPTPANSCRVVLPICYREIVQSGDTSTNYQLAAGDRIFVPSRCASESHGGGKSAKTDCPQCGGKQIPCGQPPVAVTAPAP
jgi:protein involved in polysaccharide export with SLBB domain